MAVPYDRRFRGNVAVHQPVTLLDNPSQCYKLAAPETDNEFSPSVALASPGRGGNWADGSASCSLVNTILPPGGPSVAISGEQAVDGIYTSSSYHPIGVNVALVDGSVRSMSRDVDAGNLRHPAFTQEEFAFQPPSPYGVWGALGTRAGEEVDHLNW